MDAACVTKNTAYDTQCRDNKKHHIPNLKMHDTEAPLRVPELPNNYSSLREEASTDTPLQQATLHAMTVSPNSQSSSESTLHFDDDDGILSPSNEEQPQTYHHRSTDMLDNRFQDEQRPSSSLQQRALAICAMSVVMTVACLATSTWSTVGFLGQPSATTTNGISEPDPLSLSTTNTVVEVPLHHPPENRIEMEEHRRWMEETTDLVCNDFYNTTYSETLWDQADGGNDTTATEDYISGVSCEPIGQITFEDAVILYQELCPNWPFDDQDNENETSSCGLVGAEEVLLTCKNRKTRILGGEYFPDGGYPAVDGEVRINERRDLSPRGMGFMND